MTSVASRKTRGARRTVSQNAQPGPVGAMYIVSILIGIHLILTGANCIVIALGGYGLK